MHKLVTLTIGHNVGSGTAVRHTPASMDAIIEDALTREGISNYTVTRARGMFQGATEESTVVSIVLDKRASVEGLRLVRRATAAIAHRALQDCVLLTVQDVGVEFVSAPAVEDVA